MVFGIPAYVCRSIGTRTRGLHPTRAAHAMSTRQGGVLRAAGQVVRGAKRSILCGAFPHLIFTRRQSASDGCQRGVAMFDVWSATHPLAVFSRNTVHIKDLAFTTKCTEASVGDGERVGLVVTKEDGLPFVVDAQRCGACRACGW